MARRVDRAMAGDRPEKVAVRRLWVAQIRKYHLPIAGADPDLLLLTLAGAEGREVQFLIDEQVLGVTEVGSLDNDSQGRVVAIEKQ
jgi:hypothetical protein